MNRPQVELRWALFGDLGDRIDALEAQLPDTERTRAARFRSVGARRRFVLARVLLRQLIAAKLGADPAMLVFDSEERGKPRLATDPLTPPLEFNLSHSGELVAVAVAATQVGIDIEQLRPMRRAAPLARRFFGADEAVAVLSRSGSDRDRAFLRIWTQKEAYLKATGLGVGMPLREIETEPDPTRPPRLIAIAGDHAEAERWTLLEADIPNAVCTVAVLGEPPDPIVRRVTPEGLPG